MKVSIIITTYQRPVQLQRLIDSIKSQNYIDYEIVISDREGDLVAERDRGWRNAKGDILIWLDDDIVCLKDWLKNIVDCFDYRQDVIGLTGLTIVPPENLKNRDVFRGGIFKWFYNWYFQDNKHLLPGRISRWGVNSIGGSYETDYTTYPQEVDFLEPSMFALRRWVVEGVDGFDLAYNGVGEWCDVDMFQRIKKKYPPYRLLFHPSIRAYHLPEQDKAIYTKRLKTDTRYANYCRFADRFVRPSFRNKVYRQFLRLYFWGKEHRVI